MYYFIVNEHGGSGQVRRNWHKLYTYLKEQDVPFKAYKTSAPGHAKKLAQRICEITDDDKQIIVVGGDGTINEVINGIDDFERIALGVIPLGSANDFANGLGIPKEPMVALMQMLASAGDTRIDLGQVTFSDRSKTLFSISSGIGLDALVCYKNNKSKLKGLLNKVGIGDASYVLTTVGTLFTMEQVSVTVKVDDEEPREFDKLIYLASMNMSAEGGGVKMAPNATPFDGKLTFVCGHDANKLQAPAELVKVLAAKHEKSRCFTIGDFKKMEIHSDIPMILHTDGEAEEIIKDVTIECLEGKLKILT